MIFAVVAGRLIGQISLLQFGGQSVDGKHLFSEFKRFDDGFSERPFNYLDIAGGQDEVARIAAIFEGLSSHAVGFLEEAARTGALSAGLWPALPGHWASRKSAEFDKFAQVETWVQALLQLMAPVPGTGTVISVVGGTASGSAGAGVSRAASSGPVEAAVAGGGVTGAPGIGTVAAAGSAPVTTVFAASAGAGASLLGGGVAPPEAEMLARALRDSIATIESWDVARCSQACADLVHEAAKLRPQLTLLKEIHPFGKLPMKALEANAFPAMVSALPELATEECELDELPAGKEATQEHWRAFVHLLQARVGEFQLLVKSKVPSFPLTDVIVASFFKKRKRVQFEGEEEEARAAGGGSALLPPLNAARREQLAALGSSFRTVNEEQLARALRGELAPEDIVRPPALREEILQRATIENMERCGTGENERRCYEEECERVGCTIPALTSRAHLVAAAFQNWHDVDFLVRCAACGAWWPSEEIKVDKPYRVPKYVDPEHMDVIRDEIRRESEEGRIFLARWRLPLGIIALGMVEKVRKGKVKYRPVSDYSRPKDVGVNARIELDKDEFTTVKEGTAC
ncbi:hypothetical protein CYMTET_27877 [Cymbomonas tetramitiformis]|uniref:Uncharacterized protein n=1 Tax=Cymbomonas tetramitiformis TaxID=36881 RepID=A0AAE0FP97_9CHLO|nr:hypothetical protein CYMTET_27877 [Cymbomonas tetramitiformis]